MLTQESIVTIIAACMGLAGVILGSGGGIWAFLAMRRKAVLDSQISTLAAQQSGIKSSMEAMQETVDFLRVRLTQSNDEYKLLQKHHDETIAALKAEHEKDRNEIMRQLRIAQAHFADCQRILRDKIEECVKLKDELDQMLARLRSVLPTHPLLSEEMKYADNDAK